MSSSPYPIEDYTCPGCGGLASITGEYTSGEAGYPYPEGSRVSGNSSYLHHTYWCAKCGNFEDRDIPHMLKRKARGSNG